MGVSLIQSVLTLCFHLGYLGFEDLVPVQKLILSLPIVIWRLQANINS
jgi:hypothetical protein